VLHVPTLKDHHARKCENVKRMDAGKNILMLVIFNSKGHYQVRKYKNMNGTVVKIFLTTVPFLYFLA
jgi:hypothetical protein